MKDDVHKIHPTVVNEIRQHRQLGDAIDQHVVQIQMQGIVRGPVPRQTLKINQTNQTNQPNQTNQSNQSTQSTHQPNQTNQIEKQNVSREHTRAIGFKT